VRTSFLWNANIDSLAATVAYIHRNYVVPINIGQIGAAATPGELRPEIKLEARDLRVTWARRQRSAGRGVPSK